MSEGRPFFARNVGGEAGDPAIIAPMSATTGPRVAVLRRRTTGTLVLLVIQFLVGMATNLFVSVPAHHPGAGSGPYLSGAWTSVLWTFGSGLPVLIAHVAIGILLLLSGIELVVHAVRSHRPAAVWLASLGFLAIVFAAFNGASFVKYGQNISSMLMAAGFALAVLCYVLILSISG